MADFAIGIIKFLALFFSGNFFEKAYFVFVIIMFVLMFKTLNTFCSEGGREKLDFILKAQEKGCCVVGKMTCFTKEGTYEKFYYVAEYMYMVNDKIYFRL